VVLHIRPLCLATFAILAAWSHASGQESGYQTIRGTRVYTQIDHANSRATFSNDCGSQVLTQRELQNGAIPTDIIPCPKPKQSYSEPSPQANPPSSTPLRRKWSAVAAGIDEGFLGLGSKKVGVGLGKDYYNKQEAEARAISECESRVSDCKIVGTWNSGCYFITTGNGDGVAWGSGPTAQSAYNQCRSRVPNCDTDTIGGCYPD